MTNHPHRARVITYSAPGGRGEISLTRRQAERLTTAGRWLRYPHGEEYCQVSRGLHSATPTYTDDEIAAMCA